MRTIIKTILLTAFSLLAINSHAQDKGLDQWYYGIVVMKDQKEVTGYVNVNFSTQNVRYLAEGSKIEQAFSPFQISEFTVIKNTHKERHVSLNIGDGQKFYLWLGESDEVAFLFHICGTTQEYQSYNNNATNACTSKGLFIPRYTANNRNEKILGFYGYFIGLTPNGEQYFFYKETSKDRTTANRNYLYSKRDQFEFFEQFDPEIKSYIKQKNLDFKKDLNTIITRVIR